MLRTVLFYSTVGISDEKAQEKQEESKNVVEDEESLDEAKLKKMLNEALEDGHIKTGLDVVLFIGAAGSGKSHYKNLCLGLPPPEVRDSTGLSEHPVRTMSLMRGAVEQVDSKCESAGYKLVQWHGIPPRQFIELIMEAIMEGKIKKVTDISIMQKLVNEASLHLPAFDFEREVEAISCTAVHEAQSCTSSQSSKIIQSKHRKERVAIQTEKSLAEHDVYESDFYASLIKRFRSSPKTKRGKLLDVDWLYLIDSGGQPQFREMLPVLVHMATACVLTLKLNKPLNEQNEVEYVREGKELCKPYLSVLSNKQVIQQCSQIVSSQTKNCKFFVVGTHCDLEHECNESRDKKNLMLLKMLSSHLRCNLEIYKTGSPAEVIYPVNSKSPVQTDYTVVQQFRMAVHNVSRSKVDIPLYWFLLELLLHKLAAEKGGILDFEGCKKEAMKELKFTEDTFPSAIKFLVQKLGTLMHFPQLLPNVIFTPQALMSILSDIVKFRHILNDNQPLPPECVGNTDLWLDFQKLGIISRDLFKAPPFKKYFTDLFIPNDFFQLMMKLLIVAKLNDNLYFFPSVLEELCDKAIKPITDGIRLMPLILYCSDSSQKGRRKENWLSVGSFPSLVALLQNQSKWTIHVNKSDSPVCMYRNCIQFTLPESQPGIVTLVDQYQYLKVYLDVDPADVRKVTLSVCSTIYKGLKKVHECLHYTENRIDLALLCPEHNGDHIASIARGDNGVWRWTCIEDRITSRELTDTQQLWFQEDPTGIIIIISTLFVCLYNKSLLF